MAVGVVAVAAAFSLASCAPTQSRADACGVALEGVEAVAAQVDGFAGAEALSPENWDELQATYEQVLSDVESTRAGVNHEEVGALFDPVVESATLFAEKGLELDLADPVAMAEGSLFMMEGLKGFGDATGELQAFCGE